MKMILRHLKLLFLNTLRNVKSMSAGAFLPILLDMLTEKVCKSGLLCYDR